MESQYDVIIIGSGLGGLTAASLLATVYGKKVLLIEQHYIIGGQTNEFHRKQFTWEVVMSAVGGIEKGSDARKIMDLVTGKKVQWNQLPSIYEKIVYPDMTIAVPNNLGQYQQVLAEMFPDEKEVIQKYFVDIKTAKEQYLTHFFTEAQIQTNVEQPPNESFLAQTTREYLDENFKDEKLKAVLVSDWGRYGLEPQRSSFAAHALVVSAHANGGFFPEGGSQTISQAVVEQIKAIGGNAVIGTNVVSIIVQDGKAVGVRTKSSIGKEAEYYATNIISDVGLELSVTQLVTQEYLQQERREFNLMPKGNSAVILYLGLSESPEKFGVHGENYWIYDSSEPNQISANTKDLLQGSVHGVFLSFPTLKHSSRTDHTAVASIIVDPKPFLGWYDRPPEYKTTKETMTAGIVSFIEKHLPGFSQTIAYKELGTPLTIEHFINKQRGEMFGIPVVPERFQLQSLKPKTSLPHLYLSGNDICAPGYYGALMGGVAAVLNLVEESTYDKILQKADLL